MNNSFIRKIWRKYLLGRSEIACRSHLWRLFCEAGLNGTRLLLGSSLRLHIPLRASGNGSISIGSNVSIGQGFAKIFDPSEVRLHTGEADSEIRIGSGTFINQNTAISAKTSVTIGERCLIGDLVTIMDCDWHAVDPSKRHESTGEAKPIALGDNVWIGAGAMVLKGVTIGDNTVVAAGSIVTKDLPANILAAGVPARIIRSI